jgi:hypothetical protein
VSAGPAEIGITLGRWSQAATSSKAPSRNHLMDENLSASPTADPQAPPMR